MMVFGVSTTDDIVKNAKAFGSLDSCSVWALFALLFLIYIVWSERQSSKANAAAIEVRLKQVESDLVNATAMERIADYLERIDRFLVKHGSSD